MKVEIHTQEEYALYNRESNELIIFEVLVKVSPDGTTYDHTTLRFKVSTKNKTNVINPKSFMQKYGNGKNGWEMMGVV